MICGMMLLSRVVRGLRESVADVGAFFSQMPRPLSGTI